MTGPNPLRTALTLLGMVFGVASVVAMVSIGEGAQRKIMRTIEAMGADAVHVVAKTTDDKDLGDTINDSVGVSRADVHALRALVPPGALAFRREVDIEATDLPVPRSSFVTLAVGPDTFAVHGLKITSGRGLLAIDHAAARRVAVLGSDLAQRAFRGDAVGKSIRLGYGYFEVVGVLAPRHQSGGQLPVDPAIYDRAVIVPFDTALEQLEPLPIHHEIELVTVRAGSVDGTLTLKADLAALLRTLHHKVADYELVAPEELLQQRQATQSVLNWVLLSIAAISLVVGGIGVMNIMLANVMERISEIGLRRAIGARQSDIRDQFVLEAVAICVTGGLVGILLGFIIALGVQWLSDMSVAFAWEAVVLAFLISVGTGLVFGIFPALRAARVDPIEALQHG